MKSTIALFLLTIIFSAHCFGQAPASKKVEKQPTPENKNTLCFPLQKDDVYSLYSYIIDLRDEKVHKKYAHLFSKYNYQFSGYVWSGILKDIIRHADDKDIARHVFVKGQENLVTFTITQYQVADKFPAFICPVFSDLRL
ncbi:MAG: hypothetical protein JSS96_14985, partial [Bacteroidetes bacterium]|nr:hypothetical protein [Bacteroidota bacterium]